MVESDAMEPMCPTAWGADWGTWSHIPPSPPPDPDVSVSVSVALGTVPDAEGYPDDYRQCSGFMAVDTTCCRSSHT